MALRRILIVGGSTRAAADSVRRAGWEPICADCFADLDLDADDAYALARNSFDASFVDAQTKAGWMAQLDAVFALFA